MHNNFYFLRKLSHQLKSELAGFKIGEVYSQHKNELTISLYKDEREYYIKAHLDSDFSCLYFPEKINRAKRNSIDLFREIYNLEILDVEQIENDRSFIFKLQNNYVLLFKLHGNRSNIILLEDNKVVSVFRNNLKQDFEIEVDTLSKSVDLSFENFKSQNGNIKYILPTLGKSFDKYFNIKDYSELSLNEKYQALIDLVAYLDNPNFYIHYKEGSKPILSLYEIESGNELFNEPLSALNRIFKLYISDYRFYREKSKISNGLLQQIKKCESYIYSSQAKLEKLQTAQSYSHIGDLIMANLHQIKMHTSEIDLIDYYTNESITIKLKPTLSPQLNAEKYYKKAKSQQIEIDSIQKNIALKLQQKAKFKKKLDELESIQRFKDLPKETHLHQKEDGKPYHLVSFMDYEILIGKNAKKNEQLTFEVAKKEDLFLHAKDSPGSHVIIRSKNKQNFPEKVIEKAASHAAFYSKSKNESLIRVLYTPKKYVRKAKNKPPGTVIITQEKVLLVKPEPIKK